jgi:chromosome segregation ATPase
MKNNRPHSGIRSIKTAGNNIINSKKTDNKNNLMLMKDIQTSPGNGLWCVNVEKNKRLSTGNSNKTETQLLPPQTFTTTNPNIELELEMEKKIIYQLKFQIQDITAKFNSAMTKLSDAEFRASRAENIKNEFMELYEKRELENKDMAEKVESLENTIINLNEALTNSRKEISRMHNENQNEGEKNKKMNEMYQNLMLEKDRKENSMNSEINNLLMRIQMMNNEKENLIRMNRTQLTQEKSNDYVSNLQKLIDEKDNILRVTENQLRNLINENAELKRKLSQEETFKSKLNELIKKKKVKIARFKEEVKSYREAMSNYNNEVKWNQDLVSQRDVQIKVLREKIKKQEEEINRLNKEIQKLKTKKYSNQNVNINNINNIENQEEVVQVKPKPFLFGPESDDL